ncbi:MAG: TetR/AcrR family transcriptional regulator [Pseudomonadota bacterium]
MSPERTKARPYHHGDLRQALVQRAVEIIEAEGVEAVSLRGMARDLGVSHTAPLRHFPSRASLLTAIADFGITALFENTLEAGEGAGDARGKLEAMMLGYVRWAAANKAQHLLVRNQDVMRHADASLREKIAAFGRMVSELVAAAQGEGWYAGREPAPLVLQVTSLTVGMAVVFSDPLYDTAFDGPRGAKEAEDAVRAFMAAG